MVFLTLLTKFSHTGHASMLDASYSFAFGDLNYRVDMQRPEVESGITAHKRVDARISGLNHAGQNDCAIYNHSNGRKELVRLIQCHPEADGGGVTIALPSTGGERMTDRDRLEAPPPLSQRTSLSTLGLSQTEMALSQLLQHDQLRRVLANGKVFTGYQEAPILFRPTYKFDIGTSVYDTSEKQRIPAWCDRILFAMPSSQGVTGSDQIRHSICVNNYRSAEMLVSSDHKPVSGMHSSLLLTHVFFPLNFCVCSFICATVRSSRSVCPGCFTPRIFSA